MQENDGCKRFKYNGTDTPYLVFEDGRIYNSMNDKFFNQYTNPAGYMYIKVHLLTKSGFVYRNYAVHRMVAETFIPNPENKPQVNHINGIKNDNRVSNLEWVTNSENMIHAYGKELRKPNSGEKVHFAKYTSEQIEMVCKEIEKDELSLYEIEKLTGVPHKTICGIRKRQIWKDISNKYTFPPVVVESKFFDHVTNRKIHDMARCGISSDKIAAELNIKDKKLIKRIYDICWGLDPRNTENKINTYVKYRKRHNKKFNVNKVQRLSEQRSLLENIKKDFSRAIDNNIEESFLASNDLYRVGSDV